MSIDKYTENPNTIKIKQGNYLSKTIGITNEDGTDYDVGETDVVKFAVINAEGEYLISPRVIANKTLEITPTDTADLIVSDPATPLKFTYEVILYVQGVTPLTVIQAPLWVYISLFEPIT